MSRDEIQVVGSVALDSVRTPFGEVEEALGGSASYFSLSASHFAPVRMVAVVGEDFPAAHRRVFERRGVDLSGLETAPGRTFRWQWRSSSSIGTGQPLKRNSGGRSISIRIMSMPTVGMESSISAWAAPKTR